MKCYSKIILAAAILFSATVPGYSQRTIAGSSFVEVCGSVPVPFSVPLNGIGASVLFGRYTTDGLWSVGVRGDNRVMLSPLDNEYDVSRVCASAERVWRIVASWNRRYNIYGGAGVQLGAEIIDPRGMLSSEEVITGRRAPFVYSCDAVLCAEAFIFPNVSFTMAVRPFFTGGSRYGIFFATASAGLRFSF